jgi:hypothetical protein
VIHVTQEHSLSGGTRSISQPNLVAHQLESAEHNLDFKLHFLIYSSRTGTQLLQVAALAIISFLLLEILT